MVEQCHDPRTVFPVLAGGNEYLQQAAVEPGTFSLRVPGNARAATLRVTNRSGELLLPAPLSQ